MNDIGSNNEKEINDKVAFTTTISKYTKRRLKAYCAVHDLYMNDLLEKLVDEFLKKMEEGEGGCQYI